LTSSTASVTDPPRLVVVGASGFIGRAVAQEGEASGLPVVRLGRSLPEATLRSGDVLINAALRPAYRGQPYTPEADLDRELAAVAASRGAHMIMLSSRRVYGPEHRWGARETDPAPGDETQYGRNKATTEAWLSAQDDEPPVCVLRFSNVFGFEYSQGARRHTFFGTMLASLKAGGAVIFDMAPETRRDFIPVETAARAITTAARQRLTGVFNVGSGFAVPCGALAEALFEGYESGTISVDGGVRDEFYLDVSKWTDRFPMSVSENDLIDYCRRLGERLLHA
jgi:nucleoside-diphosphate-sugar epimerase